MQLHAASKIEGALDGRANLSRKVDYRQSGMRERFPGGEWLASEKIEGRGDHDN